MRYIYLFLLCSVPTYLSSQIVSKPFSEQMSLERVEIFFETGTYVISEQAASTLHQLTQFSNQSGICLKITAHTDAVGSAESNLVLSKNRANAVKEHILQLGLTIDSLFVNYYGESQPRSNNDEENGRQDNRRCTVELTYVKKLVWVAGDVLDSLERPLEAAVIIKTKTTEDKTKTDSIGHYRLKVPFNKVASLEIYPKDHFYDTKMFKTTPGEKNLEMNFQPLRVGGTIKLNNFYFLGGLAILRNKSKPELPRLLKFMQNMPNLKINIIGHINEPNTIKIPKTSKSFQLSVQRAKLIYDYLLQQGIAMDRLSYEGKGNWEMKFPFATSEFQMAFNRRVEIKVLEK